LKKGLSKLEKCIDGKRRNIAARIARKEKIMEEEEQWLDNEGNVVDETLVVEKMERASDYECALEGLDTKEKAIVERLKELAGDIRHGDNVSKKRKCMLKTLT
jgi:hypothetical protein